MGLLVGYGTNSDLISVGPCPSSISCACIVDVREILSLMFNTWLMSIGPCLFIQFYVIQEGMTWSSYFEVLFLRCSATLHCTQSILVL